jgi:hypothetical protein
MQIDFKNPEQLTYSNDMLTITVLGGIKLEGLDRMRTTLKVELNGSARPPVRHNLDLYNDNQLEKFIRKVAEKHEVGTSVIAASLSELTEGLEKYRLDEIKSESDSQSKPVVLSALEEKEATDLLKAPNLLEKTNELIGQSGVIGEENNRLLMYLIFTSRKREQPLHIISLGASGTGKTHLQESVASLMPQEETLSVTTLSENAFYYFGQRELKNKLILIEDLDGAEGALYPLRELQSKKKISKTIAQKNSRGETRSVHLTVEGPVSVSGCTTRESIYEDNSNRSFLIYLDESPQQDKKIMNYQRAMSAGRIDFTAQAEAANLLQNAQRLLEPIKVVNPYAELLDLPTAIFKPRRTNSHYLQFIEVITFYCQRQRQQKVDEQTGELYIETTLEDIEAANNLLKEVLLRKSDELTGACRNYLESIKVYLEYRDQGKGINSSQPGTGRFSNREIRTALKINESNQKRYTLSLLYNHYIKRVKGTRNKGYLYEIVSYQEYQQLKAQVGNVMDETLEKIKNSTRNNTQKKTIKTQVNSSSRQSASDSGTDRSKVVQKKNEPRKSKKTNTIKQ